MLSCSSSQNQQNNENTSNQPKIVTSSTFQFILDSAQVKGSILLYDSLKNTYITNDPDWANSQQIPASTFKIPHSLIALQSQVIKDENTMILWDGQPKFLPTWEQDLRFADAFTVSCLPCYQQIAQRIGFERMKQYVELLQYGHMRVTEETIDTFWLMPNSTISQMEQIDFLQRLVTHQLPIEEKHIITMKNMMLLIKKNNYQLRGKTGWSIVNGDNGWFVGYLTIPNNTYYIATNIEPKPNFPMEKFASIRLEVTKQALISLGVSLD